MDQHSFWGGGDRYAPRCFILWKQAPAWWATWLVCRVYLPILPFRITTWTVKFKQYVTFTIVRKDLSNLLLMFLCSTSNDDWSALYHLVKGRKDEDTCLREEFIAASLLLLNYGQKKTKEKHQEKQSNSMMMHLYLNKTIVQSLSLVFWLHINGCWMILQCACMCKVWRAWKKELLKVLPRSTLASWVLFTLVKCIYNWVMYSYSL